MIDVILGINISNTYDEIVLSQSHYFKSVLKRFNVYDECSIKTPIDLSLHLVISKGEPVFQLKYSRVINGLIYIRNYS